MPSLLARAARVAGRISPYAVVPFALSLLAVERVASAASSPGVSVSVKFALPADVATLWTLVDPATRGVTVNTPVPLVALPVFLVVQAVVVAGFLGVVCDAYRDDEPGFVDAAADHWLSMLGVQVVEFVVFVGIGSLAVLGGGFAAAFVAFSVIVVVGYLVWAAPYLVVLRGSDAVTALAESAELAQRGGRYLAFSVGYAVAVAVCSVVVSPLVSTTGVVGVVVGAALVAYPALVGSAAATIVVDESARRVASRGA